MSEHNEDIELKLLIDAIYLKFHYDFRDYSKASLKRRLKTACLRFNCRSLSELQDKLLNVPATFPQLLEYLTVQVSEMFRDPAYFRALREQVIPVLRSYSSLRIWVAGCSAGEEAYSLAILLDEEGLLSRSRIYATDINTHALRRAEAGVYALDRVARFSENHQRSGSHSSLSHYYSADYGAVMLARHLREHIVFSDHSLATDGVFAEVELISCRNVLIYFDRALQDRAIGLFRDSLCRKGFLGIGSKESLRFSTHGPAFEEINRDERLFRKRASDQP